MKSSGEKDLRSRSEHDNGGGMAALQGQAGELKKDRQEGRPEALSSGVSGMQLAGGTSERQL